MMSARVLQGGMLPRVGGGRRGRAATPSSEQRLRAVRAAKEAAAVLR